MGLAPTGKAPPYHGARQERHSAFRLIAVIVIRAFSRLERRLLRRAQLIAAGHFDPKNGEESQVDGAVGRDTKATN